jgi:hypothetical protein
VEDRARRDFAIAAFAVRMTQEFADVAQLVEQLIRNQQVNGSSPFVGSIPSSQQPPIHMQTGARLLERDCSKQAIAV